MTEKTTSLNTTRNGDRLTRIVRQLYAVTYEYFAFQKTLF
jgi:hypothetical protein